MSSRKLGPSLPFDFLELEPHGLRRPDGPLAEGRWLGRVRRGRAAGVRQFGAGWPCSESLMKRL
jgi:hypothetical protein